MKNNTRPYIFWVGITLLFLPGLIHAYLLMPFPGSQDINAITVCYYIEKIILPLRVVGSILMLWYLIAYFSKNTLTNKLIKLAVMLICLLSYYFTDYAYKAEVMFKETQSVRFANALKSRVPLSYLVIGVVNNGVAKAYPIIYLGYHHKVQDNIGNKDILVTYCTMCRTARVYDPVVNGKKQTFRLVGARHYNAVIEDVGSKTWWYQSTGNAAVGPMKGARLAELPYEQLTLAAWLEKYPASLILQPDKLYANDYLDLKDYDRQQAVDKDSLLKNKDSLVKKSWMIGVIINGQPKAYDWRAMVKKRILNDSVNHTNLVVVMQKDKMNYHVYNSTLGGRVLHFTLTPIDQLIDKETASTWDWNGNCIAGPQKGQHLDKIQAYQEYWRSWKQFHPNTLFWRE